MSPARQRTAPRAAAPLILAIFLLAGVLSPSLAAAEVTPVAGLTVTETVDEGGYRYVHYADPAPEAWTRYANAATSHWGKTPACGAVKVLMQSSDHPSSVATANQGVCTVWVMQSKVASLTDWERCVVMVHEIGHLHGLGHTAEPDRLMSSTISWRGQLEPVPVCDSLGGPPVPGMSLIAGDTHDDDADEDDRDLDNAVAHIDFPVSANRKRVTLRVELPAQAPGEAATCVWSLASKPGRRWVSGSRTGCKLGLSRSLLTAGGRDEVRATVRGGDGKLLAKVAARLVVPTKSSSRPRVARRTISMMDTGVTTTLR